MPQKTNQTIIYFSIIIIAIASIFWVNGLILAWSPPSASPPSSNVSPPLNTGSSSQTKSGSLISNTDIRAPIFYDQDNTGYYLNPAGASILNDIRPSIMYDRNNTGYYVDPASTSRLNYGVYDNLYSYGWMQSPIFYDANNTGYYIDPASTSKFNTINLGGVSRSSWPSEGSTGYEIKSAVGYSGPVNYVYIYCSSGKKVLGGGCSCAYGGSYWFLHDSSPIGSNGWKCLCSHMQVPTVYVMCAYVN